MPGKTAHFEVVMAGFTSSGAWSSSLALAKRGLRSPGGALGTDMSGFYHENEWNESSGLLETAEQKEGIRAGILGNAFMQGGLGVSRRPLLLQTMDGGSKPIPKGFFDFQLRGGFI